MTHRQTNIWTSRAAVAAKNKIFLVKSEYLKLMSVCDLYQMKYFSEPFDTSSWMLVALVAIQAAALSIYVFEWFSPVGHNMKVANN